MPDITTKPSTAPRDANFVPLPLVANSITSGNKSNSSTSTPVAIVSSSTSCRGVEITACAGNTDTVSIGDSSAIADGTGKTGTGRQIVKGDSVFFYVVDASLLYLAVQSAGDAVSYNIYS